MFSAAIAKQKLFENIRVANKGLETSLSREVGTLYPILRLRI